MKKTIRIFAALAAVVSGLLTGTFIQAGNIKAWEAYGAEGEENAPKVVITEIFHRHIGDAEAGGGCYGEEIPHIHQGDEKTGGACYQTAVTHVHQGNAAEGGGCYTVPVTHVHQGDEKQGGACYAPVYHSHDESCYQEKICTIRYSKGAAVESWTEDCDEHGPDALHEKAEGIGAHQDCGIGEENLYLLYCVSCGIMSYSYHPYQALVCGMDTEQPVGYERSCGKTDNEIEGYETGCGMAEGSVERYQLTCRKQAEGYNRTCGLDENVPCGKLIVTSEGTGDGALVSVRLEDLSGGKLVPAENPFSWYDEAGKELGSGEQIQVTSNGKYTVELKLLNRDIDESGLRSSITVDYILSQTGGEDKTPEPSPTGGDTGENGDKEDNGDSGEEDDENREEAATPSVTADSLKNAESQNTEQAEIQKEEDNGKKTKTKGASSAKRAVSDKEQEGLKEAADSAVTPEPLQKDVTQKKIPEIKAPNPNAGKMEKSSLFKGIFAIPAVRIFTITMGTLLILTGMFLLLLYIRRSVKLYNDDGEGRLVFIGRLSVRLEEDGYAVTISEKMEEKAFTNRYCIKPGLFRIGKTGQELLVYKGEERCTAMLEREMIIMG